MLKLKLQYFGHLMRRADSLEKPLMLGKAKGRRRRGNRLWDIVKDREAQCALCPLGHKESGTTEQLNNCSPGSQPNQGEVV